MAALAMTRRHDLLRVRRPGTGRQTTRRSWTLRLPSPSLLLGKRATPKGDSRPAHDLLHDAAPAAAADMDEELHDAAGAEEVAPVAAVTSTPSLPTPPPAEPTPTASEGGAPQTGEPTPFRRANKLVRTPAAGTRAEEDEGAASSEAIEPIAMDTEIDDEPLQPAEEDAEDVEVRRLSMHSMGCSPIQETEAEPSSGGPSRPDRVSMHSMGCSPVQPELLDTEEGEERERLEREAAVAAAAEEAAAEAREQAAEELEDERLALRQEQDALAAAKDAAEDRAEEAEAEAEKLRAELEAAKEEADAAKEAADAAKEAAEEARRAAEEAAHEQPQHDEPAEGTFDEGAFDEGSFDDGDNDNHWSDREDDVEPIAAEDEVPPPPPPPEEPVTMAPPPPKTKSSKGTGGGNRRKRKGELERNSIMVLPPAELGSLHNAGGYSKRQRLRPLRFWEGERVVYGRRDSHKFESIVDVIVVESQPEPQRRQPTKRAPAKKPAKPAEAEALALAAPEQDELLALPAPRANARVEVGIVSGGESVDDDDDDVTLGAAEEARKRAASYRLAHKKVAKKA